MKVSFNITTYSDDLGRYAHSADLQSTIDRLGFDGVELMYGGPDELGIMTPDKVVGLHMTSFTAWLDFWRQDEAALLAEYDTLETVEQVFGGLTRDALVTCFRNDIAHACEFGAEYLVFHVTEVLTRELTTFSYRATNDEVIQATCELLNAVFADDAGGCLSEEFAPLLLLENLWHPGLTFTDPLAAKRLLAGIAYANTGFMLDTGHVLHTDFSLRTQEEGVAYVNRLIDSLEAHGGIVPHIRGIHLNQSLTGEYCQHLLQHPIEPCEAYWDRWAQAYSHAFKIDEHKPFTCAGVEELINRLAPEYVTFEFISENRTQHEQMLRDQWDALPGIRQQRAAALGKAEAVACR